LDLFEKEKILEENNFNEEDIIQIWKKIFYNKKSICLINDYKIYNIWKSWYELFLKTLLDNPWKICKWPDFKINNKKLKPTQKSSILDLVNDSYSYLKKTKLSFIIKYIIIYEGEWYEIKKHFN
jgi:hypothetical protein